MPKRKSLASLKSKLANIKKKVQDANLKAKAAKTRAELQKAIETGRKYRDKAVKVYGEIQKQAREAEQMLPQDWWGDTEEQQFKSVGSLVFGEPQKPKKPQEPQTKAGVVVLPISTAELLGLEEKKKKKE